MLSISLRGVKLFSVKQALSGQKKSTRSPDFCDVGLVSLLILARGVNIGRLKSIWMKALPELEKEQ